MFIIIFWKNYIWKLYMEIFSHCWKNLCGNFQSLLANFNFFFSHCWKILKILKKCLTFKNFYVKY